MNKKLAVALASLISQAALCSSIAAGPEKKAQKENAIATRGAVDSKVLAARRARAAAIALVDKGIPLLEAGQYDAAIELFSDAIGRCPELAKAYRCRGVALQMKGALDKASADLCRAVDLEPADVNNVFPRGCLFFDMEDYARASEDFDSVIESISDSSPNAALAYRYRGRCLFLLGKIMPSLRDFNEAIRLNPKLAIAYSNRGELFAANGEGQRAIDDFTRAIELDANDAWSANARAISYLLRGDVEKAIQDCNESIRRDPTFSDAYQTRSILLLQKRDIEASIADSTTAIGLDSGKRPWPFINRALACLRKQEYRNAVRDLETALELAPDNQSACIGLAYMLAACEHKEYRNATRAQQLATRACKLGEWKDAQSLDVMGMACAELSDFEKAIEHTTRALLIATYLPDSSRLCEGLRRRIELYRTAKAFHEGPSNWFQEYSDGAALLTAFGKRFAAGIRSD